ncbi:MAG: response regulator transcription factor [Planctomycetes bacterium]|nr:response regulator transcription factor [Planctomycetota bacterium]
MTAPPLVSVVDDEPTIQQLFVQLGRLEGLAVRTWTRGADFLAAFDESQPGCLVLDLNLPDMSGLQVLEQLGRRGSHIPVVFMSGLAKVSQAVAALKLGSLDFVEKPFAIDDMMAAIHRAIDSDRARRATEQQQHHLRERFAALTPRETEVMDLVVQGHANKAVAATLGVSPKTVEVHRANVMRKTGANSLAELVRLKIAVR